MESIMVDQTRRRVVDSSGGGGGRGGFAMRSRHMSLSSSSLNQLLPPNHHQYFGPISHYNLQQPQQQQQSYWASLPPASLQFPPLLPLPTKATRSTEKQPKTVNQRKGSGSSQSQARVERKVVHEAAEGLTEKEKEECIYSLSPPPSNLPLPSFVLTRQKNKGVAVEAAAGDARTMNIANL